MKKPRKNKDRMMKRKHLKKKVKKVAFGKKERNRIPEVIEFFELREN